MIRKVFTDESLKTLIDETKTYIDSSIQTPDWNQNDESAKDYIKNRPFGMVAVENEIINTNLNFTAAEYLDNIYFTEDFTSVQFTKGMTYNVYWNGEQYSCVALDGGEDYVYIGNYHMSPDWELVETIESNEPFFIVTNSDFSHSLASTSSNTPVTLQVMEMVETVKQIDEKFLPDNLATEEYVNEAVEAKADSNHNHDDVYETKEEARTKYDELSSIKSDWNQNDETAADYVKNRTHYEKSESNEIINGTFEFRDMYDAGSYYSAFVTEFEAFPECPFKVGDRATVVFDGITYDLVVDNDGIISSNGSYAAWQLGENDFLISYLDGSKVLDCSTGNVEATTHTISVIVHSIEIHKLDKKFLPDNIATVEYVDSKSTDGIALSSIEISMPYHSWSDVAYGNGKFVAVAENSSVSAYSTDGFTWTETNMPSEKQWKSVYYGGGKFVAIAFGADVAAYSTDGVTWTETPMPSAEEWQSVIYGNGKFVAISSSNRTFAYSTDGIAWIKITVSYTYPWSHIAFNNDKFVVFASNSSYFMYSSNGTTWNASYISASSDYTDIVYGNDKFVVISSNTKKILCSTNGTSWLSYPSAMPEAIGWSHIAYGCGKFIAVSEDGTVAFSTNGVNWEKAEATLNNNLSCLIYDDNKFLAIFKQSDGVNAIISYDGINWNTNKPILVDSNDNDVSNEVKEAVGTNMFTTKNEFLTHKHKVADITDLTATAAELNYMDGVTSNVQAQLNTVSSSTKALNRDINITIVDINSNDNDNSLVEAGEIAYGNDIFVLLPYQYANDKSKFAYSSDGLNWTNIDAPIIAEWHDLIYADNKFVAIGETEEGQNVIILSTDGINWIVNNITESGYMSNITYGNGRFVIGGTSGFLISSVDCINWERHRLPSYSSMSINSIVFAENAFFAYGYYSSAHRCFYSTNGTQWTLKTTNAGGNGNTIFANEVFVNVYYGSILYSYDGLKWNNAIMPSVSGASWHTIGYANGVFIVTDVNGNNNVLNSSNGITWFVSNVGSYYEGTGDKIAYGNGKFVTSGKGGQDISIIVAGKNLGGLVYDYDLKSLAEKCESNNPNTATFDKIRLRDAVDGYTYFLQIVDGTLVTIWAVSDFRIATLPTKLDYSAGEEIDISGMSVELVNDNGTIKEVTDYTYYPTVASSNEAENITIEYYFANQLYSQTFKINDKPVYSIVSVDGADYGFSLNDDGYYESENKGVDSSYAMCKILLNCNGTDNLYLDCINYAEEGYDYGLLSHVDGTLTLNNNENSDVFHSFKYGSQQDIQTINYGVLSKGEHHIYIKYIKDGSAADNNDSLQFKVRFEQV